MHFSRLTHFHFTAGPLIYALRRLRRAFPGKVNTLWQISSYIAMHLKFSCLPDFVLETSP